MKKALKVFRNRPDSSLSILIWEEDE